jgi:hypothetical protein
MAMLSILFGTAMVGAGVGAITVCRARDGEPHWLVKLPGMETAVALAIVCLLAGGLASLIAGFVSG